jgi:hypothetical protein
MILEEGKEERRVFEEQMGEQASLVSLTDMKAGVTTRLWNY